jgi:MFS family permease
VVFTPLLKEQPASGKPEGTYLGQIASTFRPEFFKSNRDIFLVLLTLTLFNLATQIFFPYLLIYLEHYIRLPALEYSILVAVAILVGGILMAYPAGVLVDRWGRRPVALLAVGCEAAGLLLFSLSRSFLALTLSGILWLAPIAAFTIATMAWTKDLYPEDKRGQFTGYYILFGVLFAMIPGPLIGGWLGSQFGLPTVLDGKPGFIPTPIIFQVAAAATLLAALPLLATKRKNN